MKDKNKKEGLQAYLAVVLMGLSLLVFAYRLLSGHEVSLTYKVGVFLQLFGFFLLLLES